MRQESTRSANFIVSRTEEGNYSRDIKNNVDTVTESFEGLGRWLGQPSTSCASVGLEF